MKVRARRRLLAGCLIVAVVWPLNWGLDGLRTHVLFFPLWFGYLLVVDGWTALRTGTSILARAGASAWKLFALSIPVWWLFEAVNVRLQNWEYVGRDVFSDVEYALLCSISFSTVIPVVFATAELVRSARWVERFAGGPRVRPTRRLLSACAALGGLMAAAMLAWPNACYPFVWVSGVFLLEPLCHRLGRRGLLTDLGRGDWRPWISLWAGVLACGFFWEMWNFHSYPKWIYHTPGAEFAHVFEMPALGYLGYLPFALELFLLGNLAAPASQRPRL